MRQLSTMYKPCTLPIYAYDNTISEDHSIVNLTKNTATVAVPEHVDDIPITETSIQRTRSGRESRKRRRSDEVLY